MEISKSQIYSFCITTLITVAVVLFLLYYMLPAIEAPKNPEQYVMVMDDPEAETLEELLADAGEDITEPQNMQDAPGNTEETEAATPPEGDEMEDAGSVAPTPPAKVTTTQESPMKVKEKTPEQKKNTGTQKQNPKPEAKPAVKATKPSESESAISKNMKNAFGKGGTGNGKGNGTEAGNASAGSDGIGSLGGGLSVGYTVAHWGRPHSKFTGTIVCQVRVNPRGKVISARAVSGSGQAWASQEARRSCEQESLKSAFSVKDNRTEEGIGTITWRFK